MTAWRVIRSAAPSSSSLNHYKVTADPPYVLRIEYRLLVSGGFDFDVIIWNPYVEHLILRLSGHSNSICGVEVR